MTDTQLPNLWTFKIPKPYKGPLRDELGNALNGFKVQDTKKHRKVSILCNGRYQRHYKFPKDVVAPKHPMIRWLNTPMCGIPLEDENGNCMSFNNAVTKVVLAGEKPVGDIMFWKKQKEECHVFLEKAKALGFEIFEDKKPFEDTYMSVMVGVKKPLKELFDLEAVIQFYHDGMHKMGFDKDYFLSYIQKVENLTPVQALQTYDWSSPTKLGELMITGLCLGYAFESTLGLMLQ